MKGKYVVGEIVEKGEWLSGKKIYEFREVGMLKPPISIYDFKDAKTLQRDSYQNFKIYKLVEVKRK